MATFLFQEDFFLPIYGIYFILLHLYAVVLKTGVTCLSAWIDPIIFFSLFIFIVMSSSSGKTQEFTQLF